MLFGALLTSTPVYAFKLPEANYEELKIGDQRDATLMQKWMWMSLPPAIKKKKIVLPCNLVKKKVIKIKVIFFDKRKNYTIKLKCGEVNGR